MSGFGEHGSRHSASYLALVLVAGLLLGAIATSYFTYVQISRLDYEVSKLQSQLSKLHGDQNVTYQNITISWNSTSLSELYERVKDSVVLIQGTRSDGTVQGSGFVYNYSGVMVIITNNHVVADTSEVSVTFSDGNGYAAVVNGTDPYADLAVLSVVGANKSEFKPLEVVSSSTLRVGDPAIAIGAPFGLTGTMTTGVISQLGRTITEENLTGGFAIANIIQTSAQINPGNSGGPLLNYVGKVVGITAAIIADSQGLGFAVPSNTILREIHALINFGTYEGHSYLGVRGTDMDYKASQSIGVNVTYGWRIVQVMSGGPAYNASVRSDDIIIRLNGTRIRNGDELSSYLEENTLPGQTLILTIARRNQATHLTETISVSVVLGQRPPLG